MGENRIGICSCGAQLTSPYSSDVNDFLEMHNNAHNGVKAGNVSEETTSQSESEKFFAAANDGRLFLKETHFQNTLGVFSVGGYRVVITPKEVGE